MKEMSSLRLMSTVLIAIEYEIEGQQDVAEKEEERE